MPDSNSPKPSFYFDLPAAIETLTSHLRQQLDGLRCRPLTSRFESLEQQVDDIQRWRLSLFTPHLLASFIDQASRRLHRPLPLPLPLTEASNDPSRDDAQAYITQDDLMKLGLSPKYLSVLRNTAYYMKRRNGNVNVSTRGTAGDLARLLMEPRFFKGEEYCKWGGLFEFTYGKTVREMVVVGDDESKRVREEEIVVFTEGDMSW